MPCNFIWIELVKGLSTALVALVVGGIAASIAYRQHKTALAKLNLDLFNERYELFNLYWTFLSKRVGDLTKVEGVTVDLQNAQHRFYFLFDKTVGDEVMEALKRANLQDVYYQVTSNQFAQPEAAQRAHAITSEQYSWFHAEANNIRTRFSKYLEFSSWTKELK